MFRYTMLWITLLAGLAAGQGFIIIDPPQHPRPGNPTPFVLQLQEQQVEVEIQGGIAGIRCRQIFTNPTRNQLHGHYVFPVPKDAVISDFTMTVNGKKMSPELLPADRAREIFDEIVRSQRDPALLEYRDNNIMRMSIFPLQPGEKREINYRYNLVLPADNRISELRLPLGSIDTSAPAENVFRINIRTPETLQNIYSPTHKLEINRKGGSEAVITGSHDQGHSSRFLQLFFIEGNDGPAMSIMTHRPEGEEGFVFFNIMPPANTEQQILPKAVTFVLDVSGSMSGSKLEKAQNALKYCVGRLQQHDEFNVIRFSTQADALFSELRQANTANQSAALDYISQFQAVGGTNIEEALSLAFSSMGDQQNGYVVFITDGKPTIGQTDEKTLLSTLKDQRLSGTRVFTLGIGEEINTHLLDKLSLESGGYRSYIHPNEDIEVRISSFFQKISSPVLTNLDLKVNDKISLSQMYPQKLPDLFAGEPLTIVARYRGSGMSRASVTGQRSDKKLLLKQQYNFPKVQTGNHYIAKIWASRAIAFMLEQIRLNGETSDLKAEIVALATRFGIVTPYTSYLIREDWDQTRPPVFRDRPPIIGFQEEDAAESYRSMERKSGMGSIAQSEKLQDMAGSPFAVPEKTAPAKRSGIQQVRYAGDKTFFLQNGVWIDTQILKLASTTPVKKMHFWDKDYRAILDSDSRFADFLAVGRQVSFYKDGIIYQIVDK